MLFASTPSATSSGNMSATMHTSTSSSFSPSSVTPKGGMRLPSLIMGSRPQLSIHMDGAQNTFTTLDRISGKIVITSPVNTPIDHLDIQFLGASKTFVEKLQTTPGMATSSSAFHNFLKLTQPIPESSYPRSKMLEAGETYEFPFLFVVPQQLLPRICKHSVEHDSIRDLHLQLPPSLGGHGDYEGWTGARLDDFAPEMANINYHIAARVQGEGHRTISLKTKTINILPNFDEQPPVNTDSLDSDYQLRKEKVIKKGLFKGRLGNLVMESDQPSSLRLSTDHSRSSTPVSTSTKIRLRFDPVDRNVKPPKLGSLSSKIKVSTWYADTARPIMPNKKCIQYDFHQGMHSEFVTLPSRSMENVEWTFQKNDRPPSFSRRDSAMSSGSIGKNTFPAASERYQGNGFYTAEIIVPVSLPTNKLFIPTFHSCLISRTYGLYLSLSIQGGTVTAPSVMLKVPVQVSAGGRTSSGSSSPRSSLTVEEQVEEARIADEFFMSRTISPLEETLVGNSTLSSVPSDLPPEYAAFASGGRQVQVTA